jgi:hypothetical protein
VERLAQKYMRVREDEFKWTQRDFSNGTAKSEPLSLDAFAWSILNGSDRGRRAYNGVGMMSCTLLQCEIACVTDTPSVPMHGDGALYNTRLQLTRRSG